MVGYQTRDEEDCEIRSITYNTVKCLPLPKQMG